MPKNTPKSAIEVRIRQQRMEHDALRLRLHPYEFFMCYDV